MPIAGHHADTHLGEPGAEQCAAVGIVRRDLVHPGEDGLRRRPMPGPALRPAGRIVAGADDALLHRGAIRAGVPAPPAFIAILSVELRGPRQRDVVAQRPQSVRRALHIDQVEGLCGERGHVIARRGFRRRFGRSGDRRGRRRRLLVRSLSIFWRGRCGSGRRERGHRGGCWGRQRCGRGGVLGRDDFLRRIQGQDQGLAHRQVIGVGEAIHALKRADGQAVARSDLAQRLALPHLVHDPEGRRALPSHRRRDRQALPRLHRRSRPQIVLELDRCYRHIVGQRQAQQRLARLDGVLAHRRLRRSRFRRRRLRRSGGLGRRDRRGCLFGRRRRLEWIGRHRRQRSLHLRLNGRSRCKRHLAHSPLRHCIRYGRRAGG